MNISQLSRDPLSLTILALLAERPRHPYEIQRLIRERKKDFARSTQRTLYHAIDRLVKARLILPAETIREGNRPERTVYQLTDDGRDSFVTWLGELLAQPAPEYPLFTVAISFLAYLPMETAVQALQARAIELEGELAGIDARMSGLGLRLHRLLLLEQDYVRALRKGELMWVRALLQEISDGRLTWDAATLREHPERLVSAPTPAGTSPETSPETSLRLLSGRVDQSS